MDDDDLEKIKDRVRELALSMKRQTDFADLQAESAGRDTGKARRFTREGDGDNSAARDAGDDFLWTMTIELYMRAEQLRERLDDLDRAAALAWKRSEQRLRQEEDHLERLRANAARDAKGERVYRTADGRDIYYEDGRRLTRDEETGVRTHQGATTWERYQDQHGRRDREIERRLAIEEYQRRLADTRTRLEGGEPLDEETLKDLEEEIDAIPADVSAELTASPSRLSAAGPAALSTASLQSGFEAAVLARDRPDDPEQNRTGPTATPTGP